MTYSKKILAFLKELAIKEKLPAGVTVMNPYQNKQAFHLCQLFYTKYYHDSYPRTLILGINPGRFGAGLTGIPFTDPVKLEEECDIKNDFLKKRELSADFIYEMIAANGGNENFYKQFYFGSVSPLGFTKNGKNLNYYDDLKLQKAVLPFILKTLRDQIAFGLNTQVAYCLGEGKNYKFLSSINAEHKFFDQIIPLAHPRFIMQYKKKTKDMYIEDYLAKLNDPTHS
ncbi:MAG TPA: uracil-DNA glycosylase family protein [Cyclobacteriaceae bacterium]